MEGPLRVLSRPPDKRAAARRSASGLANGGYCLDRGCDNGWNSNIGDNMVDAVATLKWAAIRFPFLMGAMTAIGLMLGTGVALIGNAYATAHKSVVVHNVTGRYSHEGRKVEISFDYTRTDQCVTTGVAREMWTWVPGPDGEQIQYFLPLGSGPASTNKVGNHVHSMYGFKAPDEAWPGVWFYHSNAADYCGTISGLFGPIQRNIDNVQVEITK